jgi:hypothetical protein
MGLEARIRISKVFFFVVIKKELNPFIPDISQCCEELIPNKKKRRTQLEKRLEKKNSKTGQEIKIVLLFKHESLCNL